MATESGDIPEAQAAFQAGVTLHQSGQLAAALALYRRAVTLQPNLAVAHANAGAILRDMKMFPAALLAYDAALRHNPDHSGFLSNRGAVYVDIGDTAAALADFDRAIELDPGNARAHTNRGVALMDLHQSATAVAAFDRAIALKPDLADAHHNRGNALRDLRRFDEAIKNYDATLALQPQAKFLPGARLLAKLEICEWRDVAAETAALVAGVERGALVSAAFPLHALVDSPALHRRGAEIWTAEEAPPDVQLGAIPATPRHDKIRVGYFSMDFQNHPVATLTAEMFERHDRAKFALTAFSFGPPSTDDMRERLRGAFDQFIDVSAKSNREIAELARAIELDIAVDLAGHTAGARPRIFAMRAAPVQINFLGFSGTMGAPYIDYIIADKVVIPTESHDHYSEKVITLPSFQPNDTKRPIAETAPAREALGLPREGFVFCCFNKSYKILPAVFGSWMRVLLQVPGSVLWLSGNDEIVVRNLRSEAARRGAAPERLVFAKFVKTRAEHFARHRAADLFLDSLPYNAHTTASEALWSGLPVLTQAGESFCGRIAASLLTAIGLPELITHHPRDYEAMAAELATHPQRLEALREKLVRNRLTTPLFDVAAYTRNLENAYFQVDERRRAGLPPASIYVDV